MPLCLTPPSWTSDTSQTTPSASASGGAPGSNDLAYCPKAMAATDTVDRWGFRRRDAALSVSNAAIGVQIWASRPRFLLCELSLTNSRYVIRDSNHNQVRHQDTSKSSEAPFPRVYFCGNSRLTQS